MTCRRRREAWHARPGRRAAGIAPERRCRRRRGSVESGPWSTRRTRGTGCKPCACGARRRWCCPRRGRAARRGGEPRCPGRGAGPAAVAACRRRRTSQRGPSAHRQPPAPPPSSPPRQSGRIGAACAGPKAPRTLEERSRGLAAFSAPHPRCKGHARPPRAATPPNAPLLASTKRSWHDSSLHLSGWYLRDRRRNARLIWRSDASSSMPSIS